LLHKLHCRLCESQLSYADENPALLLHFVGMMHPHLCKLCQNFLGEYAHLPQILFTFLQSVKVFCKFFPCLKWNLLLKNSLFVCNFFFLCRTPITGRINLSLQWHFLYQLWMACICMYHTKNLHCNCRWVTVKPKNSPISIAEANQQEGFMNI